MNISRKSVLTAALAGVALTSFAMPVSAQTDPVATETTSAPSPGEIVSAAPQSDWVRIEPDDLLVMQLAPLPSGERRRVVIQLMPAPISQGWVDNIRKLADAHWWDGTQVYRVQDNYVAQWGDASEEKALPKGLVEVPESEYELTNGALTEALMAFEGEDEIERVLRQRKDSPEYARKVKISQSLPEDPYSDHSFLSRGFAMAADGRELESAIWPVHCYGAVGVARSLSPNTGSGSELYTVIGHAPRHLDRNIALVGRVIEGIENLSSLPRGDGVLGFYEDEDRRVPILSVRLASELPAAERPAFEYLSTNSDSFAAYAEARANRRDPFFIVPAGGADVCNVPVPTRRTTGE